MKAVISEWVIFAFLASLFITPLSAEVALAADLPESLRAAIAYTCLGGLPGSGGDDDTPCQTMACHALGPRRDKVKKGSGLNSGC